MTLQPARQREISLCFDTPHSGSVISAIPEDISQTRLVSGGKHCGYQQLPRVVLRLLCALSCMIVGLMPAVASVRAQPPSVESAQAVDEATKVPAPAPANSASNPESVDFDIDLGTEEFENFGEEDFQVEEADYLRDTVIPIAIKIAIAAAVVLLLAWVAMKLVKPKPPTTME